MRIDGIVFDLFHTLTGMDYPVAELPKTADFLGLDSDAWNRQLFERSRWRLAGEESDPVAIIRTLARNLNPEIGEDEIREATRIRIRRFGEHLKRIPDENLATLSELRARGLRLGLVSNADVIETAGWRDSPLRSRFDAELFSWEEGSVKPEPEIYERCLSRLELSAERCLFVGDGGSRELEGARDLGFTTVLMSGIIKDLWPAVIAERRELADHEIERIPELMALLGVEGG